MIAKITTTASLRIINEPTAAAIALGLDKPLCWTQKFSQA